MTGPTFLVVGAARSGTTGLVEGLRANPAVFVTQPKEPHFFAYHGMTPRFSGPGDDHTINRVAVTDRGGYLALYPRDHQYVALGDASVSTFYLADRALPEVLAINPRMKLVLLLREPVERAYSAHQYMRARGFEPVADFEQALALEDERSRAGWHHIWHYAAMSRYADSLAALQAAVPPEQLGVWFYDDLNADYGAVLDEVQRFLGVHPHPAAGAVGRVNVSGRARFPVVSAAMHWAIGHERLRAAVRSRTSFELRERVRRTLLRPEGLEESARRRIAPRFEEDLRRLAGLLPGRELPRWLGKTEGAS